MYNVLFGIAWKTINNYVNVKYYIVETAKMPIKTDKEIKSQIKFLCWQYNKKWKKEHR